MQGGIGMDKHSIRNINPNPQNEDEVVPKQWIEEKFLNRNSLRRLWQDILTWMDITSHT